jgi:predicted RNA-binding protein with EMAP domain
MNLVSLPIAGSGGRPVLVNPEQVVCIVDLGESRSQVVTTGLQGQTSMTLVVALPPKDVARILLDAAA